MNITLVGFMGTGKTSVGKRLAKRLGWRFVDVDELIEASAKKPIARIFAEHGEAVFRRLERRTIRHVSRGDHQVIATGGGAFLGEANRSRLRATGPVICLTARPRAILERVSRQPAARPLLERAHPLERIKELLAKRAKAYAQADAMVDTSDLAVEAAAQRVWEKVSPGLCRSWEYLRERSGDLSRRYGGKYVVVSNNRVVACGDSQLEAFQKACLRRGRGKQAGQRLGRSDEAGIYYIPAGSSEPLTAR